MPLRPWPVAYHRPGSRGSAPMIGRPSGVTGRRPAHVRRFTASRAQGRAERRPRRAKMRASPADVVSGRNPTYSIVEPTMASSPRAEEVAAVSVHDAARRARRPRQRRHLTAYGCHRDRPRHAFDRSRPRAGRDEHVRGRVPGVPSRSTPDDAVAALLDADRRIADDQRAAPFRVGEQCRDQLLRIERAFTRRPRGRRRVGPNQGHRAFTSSASSQSLR